jgi:two-component system, OmpR family, alkaline phosphatase synthesis response regulator PhoP
LAKKRPGVSIAGFPRAAASSASPVIPVRKPDLRCGRLSMRPDKQEIRRDGELVSLAPKEFQLLATFMQHSGEVLPRSFLIHEIWNTDYLGDTRMLDVHIRWLRQKIEDNPSSPLYLRTVRGVGYRFEPPPGDVEA